MKANVRVRTSPEAYKLLTSQERTDFVTDAFTQAEKHNLGPTDTATFAYTIPHKIVAVVMKASNENLVHLLTTEEADLVGLPKPAEKN